VSEVRLECRSPTGNLFEALSVGRFVVVPEALKAEPGMWWLEREGYPRLDAETSHALDRLTAAAHVEPWPYRVPAARWNEAAESHPWLTIAPMDAADEWDLSSRLVAERHVDSQETLSRATSPRERLFQGAAAVAGLFAHVNRAARFALTASALGGCAYYVVALGVWLWSLRDGMTATETQAGGMLAGLALVAAWITGRFEERLVSGGVPVRLHRAEGRRRQPLLHLMLDAYRMGVVLQLLAFAGFVLT
jgi:hypothetical protein